MLINLGSGFLSLIPSPYAKRAEKRWLCTRRSSFCWEKKCPLKLFSSSWRLLEQKLRSPFCTQMIRPDRAWTAQSVTRLPELHGLARSATIRSLKVEWTSHAVIDRKNVLARASAHAVDFETKLETSRGGGGFIGNGEPPPPPPPCVRACIRDVTEHVGNWFPNRTWRHLSTVPT